MTCLDKKRICGCRWLQREDQVKTPFTNWEVSVETKRNQSCQNFDLGPSFQNSEETNFCCLEDPVCGTLGSPRKSIHHKWNILLCLESLLIHSKHIFFSFVLELEDTFVVLSLYKQQFGDVGIILILILRIWSELQFFTFS